MKKIEMRIVEVENPIRKISFSNEGIKKGFGAIFVAILVGLVTAGLFCAGVYVLASYVSVGQLDPGCVPGASGCTVAPPLQDSFTGSFSGTGNFATTGTGSFGAFQLGAAATSGYVLTANASGFGTWQAAAGGWSGTATSNLNMGSYNILGSGTVYGLTLATASTGFTIAGGTILKTLTLSASTTLGTSSITLGSGSVLTVPASGTAALGTGALDQLAYWSGTNTLTGLATGTAGYVLTATSTAPYFAWQAASGGITSLTTSTPTNLTGFIKGNGSVLSADNSTYLTTATASATYAPLASPTFTGTVTIPSGNSISGLVEEFTGEIASPVNATYTIDPYAWYGYTINSIAIYAESGGDTINIKKNGSYITYGSGSSSLNISQTHQTVTFNGNNTVSVGDVITLVTSADNSAVNLVFSIKYTR